MWETSCLKELFLLNFLCSDVYIEGESALMYFDMNFVSECWKWQRETLTLNSNPGLLWSNVLCLCIVQILMYILITRMYNSTCVQLTWYAQWQFEAPGFWEVWREGNGLFLQKLRTVFHTRFRLDVLYTFPLQRWEFLRFIVLFVSGCFWLFVPTFSQVFCL